MPNKVIDQEGNIIEESEKTVRVIVVYNSLDPSERTIADIRWIPGLTLAECLDGLPEDKDWHVFAQGNIVERENWANIVLKQNDDIVVTLQQGFVIPAIIVGVLASVGVTSAIAVSIIATTALIGILAGGYLLSGMLASPTKGTNSGNSGANYSLTGAKNTAAFGTVIPVVYGYFRMAGNKVNFYVDNGNNIQSQVLYEQYVLSEGEITNVSDVLIDNNPIENYAHALWDWRPGIIGQSPMQWFSDVISPFNVAERLTQEVFIYTTSQAIDRFRLDFQFPNGLFYVDNKGNVQTAGISLNVSYRVHGTTPWTPFPVGPAWFPIETTPLDVATGTPNQYNTNAYVTGLRLTVQVTGGTSNSTAYDIGVNIRTSTAKPTGAAGTFGSWRTGGNVPGVANGAFVSFGTAIGNFSNDLITNPDGSVGYLPGTFTKTFEIDNLAYSTYDYYVTGGTVVGVQGYLRIYPQFNNNYKGTWNVSLPSQTLTRAVYDISVQRTSPEYDAAPDPQHGNIIQEDEIFLQDVNEILDDVIAYNQTAYAGLEAALGDQITSDPNVTFLVQGKKVNIYDRNGSIDSYQFSNNPADISLDILLNPNHRFDISTTRIDFPAFDNWRTFCYTNNLLFNGAFDAQTNVWDALMQVMRVGHAGPALVGLRWSVVIEGPADPVMMFSQDNIIKGSFKNEFTGTKNRSNMVEIQYWDETDYYQQHSAFAFDDSIASGYAFVQSTLEMIGINNLEQAQNEAWFQLNLNRYLNQSCSFDVFVQAMGCSIGDVVYVQHDMPLWGYSARVISFDGTNLVIDSEVPGNGGSDWYVANIIGVRQFANSTVTANSGSQITCGAMSAPTGSQLGPNELISGPAGGIGNWQNEINNGNGASRVLINNVDYGINDQQIINGNLVLTLDSTFTGAVGNTVQLFKNDQFVEASLAPFSPGTPGVNQTLQIGNWTGDAGWFFPNDRIIIGETTYYKKPFRVQNITYKTDHVRTLSCIEYNASIYGPNPQPTPNSSQLAVTYQVLNLRGQQTQVVLPGGALQYGAQFQWDMPLNDPNGYSGATVYIGINNNPPTSVGNIQSPVCQYNVNANFGDTVFCKVVAYDIHNKSADTTSAPTSVVIIGQSNVQPTPIPLSGFTATGSIRMIALQWNLPTDDFIAAVELWESTDGTNVSDAYLIYSGLTNYFVRSGLNPQETLYYYIRSKSIAGTYSNFVGPVSATTSLLLTSDLEAGILSTASFAQGISPVALFQSSATNPIPTSLQATGGVQLLFDETTGQLYRWNGSFFTAAVPAVDISGELTANQIQSLNTDQLTGKIVAGQLDSASVLTENLAVGSPTNFIWNSCCTLTAAGWNLYYGASGQSGSIFATSQTTLPQWNLAAFGTGGIQINTPLASNTGFSAGWNPGTTNTTIKGIAVAQGQLYGGAALVVSTAPVVSVNIDWYDASGNLIYTTAGTAMTAPGNSGNYAYNYTRVTVQGMPPSNAGTALFRIYAYNNTSNQINSTSYLFFTQAMFGPMPPNATSVGSWQPGGVTNIDGGCINTETITTNQLAANSVTTNKLVANSVTTGIIAAGAVNAGQIAAGAVFANNLAANFALFDYEQVGVLNVTTLNLVGDSATSFSTVTQNPNLVGTGASNTSQVLNLTVSVSQQRQAVIFLTGNQSVSGGGNQPYTYVVNLNGNTIYNRQVAYYLDYVGLTFPVTLQSGNNTVTVQWGGTTSVTLLNINVTVFGRIV